MVCFNIRILNSGAIPLLYTSFIKFDVAIAFKSLLKMGVLKKRLNKIYMEKVGQTFWAMCQCMLNVPLWNEWKKATYKQVHGSPVLRALKSIFLVNFCNKCLRAQTVLVRSKLQEAQNFQIVFHWRKCSCFVFIYIFPLVLLFIS